MFSQILPLALVLALVPTTFAQVPISDKALSCVKKIETFDKNGNSKRNSMTEPVIVNGVDSPNEIDFGIVSEENLSLYEGSPYVFHVSAITDQTGKKFKKRPLIALNLTDKTNVTRAYIKSILATDNYLLISIHDQETSMLITIKDCKLATELDLGVAKLIAASRVLFYKFWNKVDSDGDGVAEKSKLEELVSLDMSPGNRTELEELRSNTQKNMSWEIFRILPDSVEKELAK